MTNWTNATKEQLLEAAKQLEKIANEKKYIQMRDELPLLALVDTVDRVYQHMFVWD